MRKIRFGLYLFLTAALLSCSGKPDATNNGAAGLIFDGDGVKLAAQFDADSAKTRLVILLSPT